MRLVHMVMVAARLGSKRTIVGTEWANSSSGCMDVAYVENATFTFFGGWEGGAYFWQERLLGLLV